MTRKAQPKQIIIYADPDAYEPFVEWIDNLRVGKERGASCNAYAALNKAITAMLRL
ncbi:MAG: hypothetical protein SAK29_20010 [Scytonema sp. PMC 1069.18]|nr:hypothetical protein [Scytonema sp. PMC 1069.18]MEC4880549.1 hypothetical protein [Scytonema sp. PMC 1070.18]